MANLKGMQHFMKIGLLIVLFFSSFPMAQSSQSIDLVAVDGDSDLITIIKSDTNDPFRKEAMIRFRLRDSVHVSVTIRTIHGETVRELISKELKAGTHSIAWDCRCDDGRLGRVVFDYFVKRAVRVPWPTLRRRWGVEVAPPYVTHTLEDKAEALYRAGFLVQRLREPRPDPEAAERSRKDYEQLVTGPHFIVVRATKWKS